MRTNDFEEAETSLERAKVSLQFYRLIHPNRSCYCGVLGPRLQTLASPIWVRGQAAAFAPAQFECPQPHAPSEPFPASQAGLQYLLSGAAGQVQFS